MNIYFCCVVFHIFTSNCIVYPFSRPWRPIGLCDVEFPTFSRQSAHRWRWGCQPYAPAALYPPGRFLVLISVRGWVDLRTIMRLEGLGQFKNPMTSSGFESATFRLVALVPQPTRLLRAPKIVLFEKNGWEKYAAKGLNRCCHNIYV
jgi:hypothetical protein